MDDDVRTYSEHAHVPPGKLDAPRTLEEVQVRRVRSILERTSEDQIEAIRSGYSSVAELALDELTELVLQLEARIEKLEKEVEA